MLGGRTQHLGEPGTVGVQCTGGETRLGAQRHRQCVERMVDRTERSRLGDLAHFGSR